MFGLPWYTSVALGLVLLFVVGVCSTCIKLVSYSLSRVFLASWIGFNVLLVKVFGWAPSSYGTAHFASKREMERAGVLQPDGLPIGAWKERTLVEPKGGHIALFGPPRSRKSWGMIMPCLRTWQGSAVISDLRGELHAQTGKDREAFGPVFKYNPADPQSCSLNLLDMVRWHDHRMYSDLHRIVTHILSPAKGDIASPFAIAAHPLLIAIAIDRYQHGEGNFPAIVEWMVSADMDMTAKLKTLLASPDPLVSSGARRTLDMSERLRSSVWNAALNPLALFQDPMIARHCTKSDVLFSDLLYGVQPVSVFLAMPFNEISRLGVMIGAMVDSLVAVLGSPTQGPREAPHRVLLCLDETANLGRLGELEKAVSYLQGSGTQVLLTFQNLAQVHQTYGADTPLLASVSTQVHFTPVDLLTSEYVASLLGETTVTATSLSAGTFAGLTPGLHDGLVQAEHQRTLLTADEVRRFPRTGALIFTEGTAPILARKLGTPPPTKLQETLTWAVRHPGMSMALAACCALVVALWPLTRIQTPPTVRAARATLTDGSLLTRVECAVLPTLTPKCRELVVHDVDRRQNEARKQLGLPESSIIPPTSGPWAILKAEIDRHGKPSQFVTRRYPDQESCTTAMHKDYAWLLAQMHDKGDTEIERHELRIRWRQVFPGQRPGRWQEVSCGLQPE